MELLLGNVDHSLNARHELVVSLQVAHFLGKIPFNGFCHATVQELGVASRVEIAVEIRSVVQHLDIAIQCGAPLEEVQERLGVRLQYLSVLLDPAEYDSAYGKYKPRGIEPATCQNVMNKPAMNSSIAIFERMNVNESERNRCCGNDRI